MKVKDFPFIGKLIGLFEKEEHILGELESLAKKMKPTHATEDMRVVKTAFRDRSYTKCPIEYVKAFNAVYCKYRPKYEKAVYDCDNHAVDYMAFFYRFVNMIKGQDKQMALGMCSGYFKWGAGGHHQVNFFIDGGVLYLVEPQSGKIYPKEKLKSFTLIYI